MSWPSEVGGRKSEVESRVPNPKSPPPTRAVIFDVDGVLVDSPHFRAWGEALRLALPEIDAAAWTQAVYQAYVAGMPRYDGSAAMLTHFGVADPEGLIAKELGDVKQACFLEIIDRGDFSVYDDALRFAVAAKLRGQLLAVASSSKNAHRMLSRIPLRHARVPLPYLIELFDANVCGLDVRHGKPAPDIFLAAASALGVPPAECVVAEDTVSGVQAAKACGMRCIGVARHGDARRLTAAGADMVVTSLDDVQEL